MIKRGVGLFEEVAQALMVGGGCEVAVGQVFGEQVIEPIGVIFLCLMAGQQSDHFAGQFRLARGRILLLMQGLGETVKIMDGARQGGDIDQGRPACHPVDGSHQNGLGARPRKAQFTPAAALLVIDDGIHRRAVTEKNQRHVPG